MKRPPQRKQAQHKTLSDKQFTPEQLEQLASTTRYIGSPEHKIGPSFAGQARPRADANICDPALHQQQNLIRNWLKTAIIAANFSEAFDGAYPRYVWAKIENQCYEARLTNQGNGSYKGYPIEDNECPPLHPTSA